MKSPIGRINSQAREKYRSALKPAVVTSKSLGQGQVEKASHRTQPVCKTGRERAPTPGSQASRGDHEERVMETCQAGCRGTLTDCHYQYSPWKRNRGQ